MAHEKLTPVVVSGFSSQQLAGEIATYLNTHVVEVQRRQFTDKEIQTNIQENVRGREVVVVASGSGDPNKQEKEARLLMRAAKRAGAKTVTLVLPYMWYGRSDDNWDERASPALTDTIETLREHCDNVVIADPHNHGLTREKFVDGGSPVRSCVTLHFAYPCAIQLKSLFNTGALSKENLLLSHADAGSTKRISRSFRAAIYNVLDLPRNPNEDDWAQGLKDRDKKTNKSHVKGFSADVTGKDVVIFEDMLGTGGTATDLARFLKEKGARSVTLFGTSGLFTPKEGEDLLASIQRIDSSQLDAVFITDTYDHTLTDPEIQKAINDSPIIHTIKTAPYIGAIVKALHAEVSAGSSADENSISAIVRGKHADQEGMAVPTELKDGSPLRKLALGG